MSELNEVTCELKSTRSKIYSFIDYAVIKDSRECTHRKNKILTFDTGRISYPLSATFHLFFAFHTFIPLYPSLCNAVAVIFLRLSNEKYFLRPFEERLRLFLL